MGFATVGSDLNEKFLKGARKNFEFFAEKFRYEKNKGEFFVADASDFPWAKYREKIMVTEGWLGENFERSPDLDKIEQEASKVLKMWKRVFQNMEKNGPKKRLFVCRVGIFAGKIFSISQKFFEQK